MGGELGAASIEDAGRLPKMIGPGQGRGATLDRLASSVPSSPDYAS